MKNSLTGRQSGISLIVVLILTVIIGLTASAAMRGATSSQRLTNNVRMENMAQQYAEAALRFCEAQIQIPFNTAGVGARVPNLAAANIPVRNMAPAVFPALAPTGQWESSATWTATAGTGAAIARVDLQAGQYSSALSSSLPAVAPQCAAEMQVLTSVTSTFTVTVVTSRGFSSDYTADANGETTKGSVVWLQSILNVCPGNQAAITLNATDPC
jgi:type IV pilus assembly protein PilX